jgi:hypothetical protein
MLHTPQKDPVTRLYFGLRLHIELALETMHVAGCISNLGRIWVI